MNSSATMTKASAAEIVQLARHQGRPTTLDYIEKIGASYIPLHGDRNYGDDPAIIGGLVQIDDVSVMIIGHQKGKNTKDNLYRNFGMAHPEGYRKALRLMKMAEKFNRPIITLVDTPGAYPGIGAEERGQAEAIARNLREMAILTVPVVVVITGEGGSGGALGIGVGNRVLMMENSIYSVISPEGCASILFRDAKRSAEAAEAMKITAPDLIQLGIIDEIVPEPAGGAHNDPAVTAETLKRYLLKHIGELSRLHGAELAQDRLRKFRRLGVFEESPANFV